MSKPLTDAELQGWRDTLTDLERRLVSAEHDVKAGLGTPDGLGYTMAQRGYFRGRLAALTKARDGLLPTIAREQARRQNDPASTERGLSATETGDTGLMSPERHDTDEASTQDATARQTGEAAA